jgi:uncharacterized protein
MNAEVQAAGEKLITIDAASAPVSYKPSRFNAHTVNEEGHLILYNSFSGHVCAFPPAASARVKTYLSRVGTSGPLDKLGKYLLEKGYIVESKIDEDARFDVRYGSQQFRTDVLELILLASEDCNFRCIYCSQQFKRGSIRPEVRTGIRALVQNRIRRLQRMQISWFGGEPLMGYDAIEELAPFFQNAARENGVLFHSDITTNGYLLTPERSRKMVQWGINNYQITLDGTPLEHDSHRVLADGTPTFAQILENIIAMKDFPEPFTVAVRVNFDNTNLHKLQPLFSLLKDKVGNDSRFVMRFRPVEKWGGPNDAELNTCGMDELHQQWTGLIDQARTTGLKAEDLAQTLDPRRGVCYAARPYNYIIGADGKLMKCTVVLDTNPANIVGSLGEDGTINLNNDNFAKWVQPYYKTDKMCTKCFYVPVCEGVCCPLPRILTGERPCPVQKLHIKDTLNYVWSEKQATKKPNLVRISAS